LAGDLENAIEDCGKTCRDREEFWEGESADIHPGFCKKKEGYRCTPLP
jgi:hypothetical protein